MMPLTGILYQIDTHLNDYNGTLRPYLVSDGYSEVTVAMWHTVTYWYSIPSTGDEQKSL